MKKKLVYISHPSSGLEENTLDIEKIIRMLYADDKLFDSFCFVSPVHCYGFMYHETEYFKGLSFCTDLLKHCDLMLVFGDWKNSVGCTEEVKLCEEINIPYIIMGNSDDLEQKITNGLVNEMIIESKA